MEWLLMGTSAGIALALAIWTIVREDTSTSRRGRHRSHGPRRAGAQARQRPAPA